ncbi:MAG: sortase [Ilumatobacteraceae bacterium]
MDAFSAEQRVTALADTAPGLGRRSLLVGAAGAAGGVAAAALFPTPARAVAGAVEPGASYFVPTEPIRLCDTRNAQVGIGFRRINSVTVRLHVGGNSVVPANAVAVALTVTGVNLNNGGNWLSAYPSDRAWPGTASSNSETFDQRIANLVTVKLGRGASGVNGALDLRSMAPSHVVVDLAGYYVPTATTVTSGRFEPKDPVRLLDTRTTGKLRAGGITTVRLNGHVPNDAIAAVVNITAVETGNGGYVTAYPRGAKRPLASSLNYGRGENRGAAAMVKLATVSGVQGFDLYTLSSAHVVVDLMGYMTGPGGNPSAEGLFVPIDPQRLLDTRSTRRRIWPGGTVTFGLPAAIRPRAKAVAMNLAVAATINAGYFTASAAQTPRKFVSSLNAIRAGQTVANHAFSRVSTAGVSCFTQGGAHIIGDVTGWYTGTPARTTTAPPFNPPPPGGPIPWIVSIPRLGLTKWVFDGDANRTVDAGHVWHWTGTGLVGEGADISLFGHRTEHGGPLRYQHALRAGDLLYINTSDARRYTYRFARTEFLGSSWPASILTVTRRVPGETVSLISCSKSNWQPTDTRYRLITTFTLVGWDDLG